MLQFIAPQFNALRHRLSRCLTLSLCWRHLVAGLCTTCWASQTEIVPVTYDIWWRKSKCILRTFRGINFIEITFAACDGNMQYTKSANKTGGGGKKKIRPWQDSNLQSSDPKSDALSIRPHGHCLLISHLKHFYRTIISFLYHVNFIHDYIETYNCD